jgi:Ni,Fe-hydrogenase I small subunit
VLRGYQTTGADDGADVADVATGVKNGVVAFGRCATGGAATAATWPASTAHVAAWARQHSA